MPKGFHVALLPTATPRVCKTLEKLENSMVLGVCIGGGRESYSTLLCRGVREMKAGKILQRNFSSLSLCY